MTSNVYEWIKKEEGRKKILTTLKVPLTAKQLTRKTGIPEDTCSYTIAKFANKGLFVCLNPNARNSRLYWLTESGRQQQEKLCQDLSLPYEKYDLPDMNWDTYGWLCYNHRSIVISTLTKPMQPSEIKRVLRVHKPLAKISANNIRDIIKLFSTKQIVQPVKIRKKAHPRYELTDSGRKMQQLLIKAESII